MSCSRQQSRVGSTADGDEKLSEWRIKLKSFLWQSVGVMQTIFPCQSCKMFQCEIVGCSSQIYLERSVHLRKTCDEKQGKCTKFEVDATFDDSCCSTCLRVDIPRSV